MINSWTVMHESTHGSGDSRVQGFTYECPDGHEWFIPLDQWADRGANECSECATHQVETLDGPATESH
jgi:hypothetical protein